MSNLHLQNHRLIRPPNVRNCVDALKIRIRDLPYLLPRFLNLLCRKAIRSWTFHWGLTYRTGSYGKYHRPRTVSFDQSANCSTFIATSKTPFLCLTPFLPRLSIFRFHHVFILVVCIFVHLLRSSSDYTPYSTFVFLCISTLDCLQYGNSHPPRIVWCRRRL